jgi:hypothetical protein
VSSRGQGRWVLRPPPTDGVPSKFLDPETVDPFGPVAAGSLRKLQAVSTKRKAGSAQRKADPLHFDSRLLLFPYLLPPTVAGSCGFSRFVLAALRPSAGAVKGP